MEQELLLPTSAKIEDREERIQPEKFIPGTYIQYAWSASSLEDFKRCPRLYQYKKIDGWEEQEESVHLRFGHEVHYSFQDYEISRANGLNHDDALHDVVRALLQRTYDWSPTASTPRQEKALKYKNRPNLVRTVIWHLEKYRDDNAKTYIKEDGEPAVELEFRFELDWGPLTEAGNPQPYVLYGILDKVVDFNGDLFVMDHKTTTTTPSDYYFNQFEPNNQMTLYAIAGEIVFNTPIRGVIVDAMQVAIDFSRSTRGITSRTKGQTEEWLNDLKFWFAKAEDYAAEGYWPMNDTACDKYGGCKFREICSKDPSVREKFLKSDFVKGEGWDPSSKSTSATTP